MRKLVSKGCILKLVWVNDSSAEVSFLQSISILKEFPEVFLDDQSKVSPEKEIYSEFFIFIGINIVGFQKKMGFTF